MNDKGRARSNVTMAGTRRHPSSAPTAMQPRRRPRRPRPQPYQARPRHAAKSISRELLLADARAGCASVAGVQKIIREEKPAKVNIDVGGLGVGVYDRLYETSSNRRV
jgi:hypothetical protein